MSALTLNFDAEALLTVALRNAIASDRDMTLDDLPDDLPELVKLARKEALDEDLSPDERRKVEKVLSAFERLEDGSYGVSVVSGQPISEGRLRAMPWADCTALEAHRRSDAEGTLVLQRAATS